MTKAPTTTFTANIAAGRLARRIDAAIADLTAARSLLEAAVRRLDDAAPGYPSAPATGSSAPTGEDTGPSTQPERHASIVRDDAARDVALIELETRTVEASARELRTVTERWGVTRLGANVADTTDAMWCRSCLRANHCSPRRVGHGDLCRWCGETLRAVNVVRAERRLDRLVELPIEAVQRHASGARVTARDVERWATIRSTPKRRKRV